MRVDDIIRTYSECGLMRIAFAIMKLFPGGGLQRDCVAIARHIRARGHDVVIFTSFKDDSDFADDLVVAVLPVRPGTNHRMQEDFAATFRLATSLQAFDLAVGFDKLTHLDVLYCADPSVYWRMTRERLRFLFPRYRTYLDLERASFGRGSATKLLMLSEQQLLEYRRAWGTAPERLTLLPPTISAHRRHPEFRDGRVRADLRRRFALAPADWVWCAIGVQPHTKGLDRTLRAMRAFPDAKLMVAGIASDGTRAAKAMAALAKKLKLLDRISWLGHREDVPELMAAADLLVHPARYDTTGTVILEAIVNGLPVVTTSVCGYAAHVGAAEAGIVIDDPFDCGAFAAALAAAGDVERRQRWSACAAEYGKQAVLYEGLGRAGEIIIAAAAARARRRDAGAVNGSSEAGRIVYLQDYPRQRGAGSQTR